MITSNHVFFFFIKLLVAIFFTMDFVKSDPDPLHDYCVADTTNPKTWLSSGVPCIDPDQTTASHFASSALSEAGDMNQFGFNVTITDTTTLPGLNTLGLSMARIDLAGDSVVPLHTHPRASELTIVLEGSLLVGFVDTTNRLYTQRLRPGDCFVFPRGLMHFMWNVDFANPAVAVSGLSSQNPGVQVASVAAFTSNPLMPDEVLKKGFKMNGQDVGRIRRNLGG